MAIGHVLVTRIRQKKVSAIKLTICRNQTHDSLELNRWLKVKLLSAMRTFNLLISVQVIFLLTFPPLLSTFFAVSTRAFHTMHRIFESRLAYRTSKFFNKLFKDFKAAFKVEGGLLQLLDRSKFLLLLFLLRLFFFFHEKICFLTNFILSHI